MNDSKQKNADEAKQQQQSQARKIMELMGDWARDCNPINGAKLFLECQHFLREQRFASEVEFRAAVDALVSAEEIFIHPKTKPGGADQLWLSLRAPATASSDNH